jgi:hypothetical protein
MSVHYYFSPSSGEKWINCSAAAPSEARVVEQYGEEPPKPHMLEGTGAHKKLELLQKEPNPKVALYKGDYTEEERACFLPYLDAVDRDLDMLDAEILIEERLISSIEPVSKRLGGTADTIVYSRPERKIVVTDYKHGVGHYVEAEAVQLQIYGHMAVDNLGGPEAFDTVILRVVQPRFHGGGEPVREHVIDNVLEWYTSFRQTLLDAINAADKDPKPTPGDHCRWCKAAGVCSALALTVEDICGTDTKQLDPEVGADMDTLTRILAAESSINAVFKQAKSLAAQILTNGGKVPGYGLKESLGNRQWADKKPESIAAALRRRGLDKSLVWVKKLISPSQAEKQCELDEKFMDKFVIRESKGLKLTKLKPGEAPATVETAKQKLEKTELTESEKALIEGF